MPRIETLLTALALGLCGLFAADATPAAARDYPFCLMGRDFAGYGDCQFETYAQCQASASGREAYCGANPFLGYYDRKAQTVPQRPSAR